MKSKVQSPKSRVAAHRTAGPPGYLLTHHAARITDCSSGGFTMIQIAVSLAIIGFALVAIIGILPTGMGVQKTNRQETIVNQDATIWLDAIRNGARGLDDLTNYVLAITNVQIGYDATTNWIMNLRGNDSNVWAFTLTNSAFIRNSGSPSDPQFPLTNGLRIIGLLSTPRFTANAAAPGAVFSNHVIAIVRSMSGPASEKYPQANSTVLDLALSYRLICDIAPYGPNYYDPLWTNYGVLDPNNTPEILLRSNYMRLVWNYETNLHDLRLTFRWPLLPSGDVAGNGSRQTYRTLVSGAILTTNDWYDGQPITNVNLYFFRPRTFIPHKDS